MRTSFRMASRAETGLAPPPPPPALLLEEDAPPVPACDDVDDAVLLVSP
jgi:hypothetical protein